jgi:hypothetical protein
MEQKAASRKETFAIGTLAAGIGLYFILVAFGVLPIPGGERNLHGPLWIVFCCGLAFLLAGIGAILPAAVTGEARNDGELPASAPQWLRVAQYLLGVVLFGSFALIGTWVALYGDARGFSIGLGGLQTGGGATIGRIAFGIGAVITWLCTIGFAVAGWRRLVQRA